MVRIVPRQIRVSLFLRFCQQLEALSKREPRPFAAFAKRKASHTLPERRRYGWLCFAVKSYRMV